MHARSLRCHMRVHAQRCVSKAFKLSLSEIFNFNICILSLMHIHAYSCISPREAVLARVAALAHGQHVWVSGTNEEQLAHPVRFIHAQPPAFTGALKPLQAINTLRGHLLCPWMKIRNGF